MAFINFGHQKKNQLEEYKERFRNEMLSSVEARTIMKDIKMLSKDVDIYFIYSCHNKKTTATGLFYRYDKPVLIETLFFHSDIAKTLLE
jgi:uncharacterized protein YeaO (DUF488 family)